MSNLNICTPRNPIRDRSNYEAIGACLAKMGGKESMPEWLCNYSTHSRVSFRDIMSSRIGFYPGSGTDGMLVHACNIGHVAHSYIYVDYLLRRESLVKHLDEHNSIRGYHRIGRLEWRIDDILPNGRYSLPIVEHALKEYALHRSSIFDATPYCFTDIMERDFDKEDNWGASRFAITFLASDGIDTYYQLFCKEYKKSPFIVLLQDHAFGGNYDSFGKGGLLDDIVTKNNVRPKFIIFGHGGRNQGIWDGYKLVGGLPAIGSNGMPFRRNSRNLYYLSNAEPLKDRP